jgi:hypothetical protein
MRNKPPNMNDGAPGSEDVCAGHALGFPLRRELGFSPIENITLDVFRCICEVYTSGSAQPWEIAIKISEENLSADDGPHLVARVTALLRALRAERKVGFSYLSVGCQHVSPDELAICGLLKAARFRDELGVQQGLMLALDKPQTTTRTQSSARSLAALQLQLAAYNAESRAEKQEFQRQTVQAIYLH